MKNKNYIPGDTPKRMNYVTPKYDITWYVKWAVSIILLLVLRLARAVQDLQAMSGSMLFVVG